MNATDAGGRTPLHVAAEIGSEPGVSALIAAQSNPLATDAHGNQPHELATRAGYVAVGATLAALAGVEPTPGPRVQTTTRPRPLLPVDDPALGGWGPARQTPLLHGEDLGTATCDIDVRDASALSVDAFRNEYWAKGKPVRRLVAPVC